MNAHDTCCERNSDYSESDRIDVTGGECDIEVTEVRIPAGLDSSEAPHFAPAALTMIFSPG